MQGSAWGAVSTAFIADATPIALTAHTRSRYAYGPLIEQALNGFTNTSWTKMNGPDAYFGGGAEQFIAGSGSYLGKDYYQEFAKKGYSISLNKTALLSASNSSKALGIFCTSNLPVWIDRNVFSDNLKNFNNDPTGVKAPATDLPGLKEMTLKAIDVLHTRGGDKGFFLMAEAASIDKQMHVLDYDRALGDLLELDDTVRATIAKLEALGELEETLIVVSADHGHGFGRISHIPFSSPPTACMHEINPVPLTRCLRKRRYQVPVRAEGRPQEAQRCRRLPELGSLPVHNGAARH